MLEGTHKTIEAALDSVAAYWHYRGDGVLSVERTPEDRWRVKDPGKNPYLGEEALWTYDTGVQVYGGCVSRLMESCEYVGSGAHIMWELGIEPDYPGKGFDIALAYPTSLTCDECESEEEDCQHDRLVGWCLVMNEYL